MTLSRSARVKIMLAFSTVLFFLELIVGYLAGSIALVADSFHMLNDVLSLVIALYAIHLSQKKTKFEPRNTYGWQRSEILGALMNGVLLLGLCLTIYIEAFQRFFILVEIDRPQLVLFVGVVGLTFNIVGMFLFGDAHSHQHQHTQKPKAQNTQALLKKSGSKTDVPDAYGNYTAISPILDGHYGSQIKSSYDSLTNTQDTTPSRAPCPNKFNSPSQHNNTDNLPQDLNIIQANYENLRPDTDYPAVTQSAIVESASVIRHFSIPESSDMRDSSQALSFDTPGIPSDYSYSQSNYIRRKDNFYVDPFISIVINTLIVCFTIPLIKSASFILLQGVPISIDIKAVYRELAQIPYVINVHELHIWQLSDTKVVASVHLVISKVSNIYSLSESNNQASSTTPQTCEADHAYMLATAEANRIFHKYGIHSATVQPEFADIAYNSGSFANTINDSSYSLQSNNYEVGENPISGPNSQNSYETSYRDSNSIRERLLVSADNRNPTQPTKKAQQAAFTNNTTRNGVCLFKCSNNISKSGDSQLQKSSGDKGSIDCSDLACCLEQHYYDAHEYSKH
ncbi:hypothetical protein BB560_003196 [Smittium megazygosporum]|uniref:Cation efflux protein cytoplasmic domain-containing protein n=1 Tax=Smittium megazygosporum TaxID=133381 RepID=A0A2T9ZCM7_9FUNG|nr:hypothetical protein BB560_003196 [Smittium megazygosporum]